MQIAAVVVDAGLSSRSLRASCQAGAKFTIPHPCIEMIYKCEFCQLLEEAPAQCRNDQNSGRALGNDARTVTLCPAQLSITDLK